MDTNTTNNTYNRDYHLIRGSHVIGLKIFAIDNGAEIDKVDDIIYDPASNQVRALLVNKGGLFSSDNVILLEDVKSIGKDAVIVEHEDVLRKSRDVGEDIAAIAKDDTYLTRAKIVTETGVELGKVTDILFRFPDGVMEELEVSEGAFGTLTSGKKRVKVADIVTIGKDATIVKAYAEEKFEQQAQEQGAQGAFMSGKSKGQDLLGQAKDAFSDVAAKTKTKADELSDKAKTQSTEMRTKADAYRNDPDTQEKMDEYKTQASQILQNAQVRLSEAVHTTRSKFDEAKTNASQTTQAKREEMEIDRRNSVVGKYVTVNILSKDDRLIAKRGDIITHTLLDQAEQNEMLDQVINNSSAEPLF
jgi:uncharacterized protein YrrD